MALYINSIDVSDGVVRNEANNPTVFVTISGVSSQTTSVSISVKDGNTVVYQYTKTYSGYITTAIMTLPLTSCMPEYKKWYTIECEVISGSDYAMFLTPNVLYRNPSPQTTLGLNPNNGLGTVRDEQPRNLKISYTSNNINGICNCYRLICTDTMDNDEWWNKIYPLGNVTSASSDVFREATFTFNSGSFKIQHTQKFEFIPGFRYLVNGEYEYLWSLPKNTIINNAYYRDPVPNTESAIVYSLPINSSKVGSTYNSAQPQDASAVTLKYTNGQTNGIATGCTLSFYTMDSGELVYQLDFPSSMFNPSGQSTYNGPTLDISELDPQYIGSKLKLLIVPYFEDSEGNQYTRITKTINNAWTFDAGLDLPEILAPQWGDGEWFTPINTVNPTFKIAIKLPCDLNEPYYETMEDYEYDDVAINMNYDNGVIQTSYVWRYKTNPEYFGVTDEKLGYQSLVMFTFNIDGKSYVPPNATDGAGNPVYNISVYVYSKTRSMSERVPITITMKPFPVTYIVGTGTGNLITADRMYEFFVAEKILRTWTQGIVSAPLVSLADLKGREIRYGDLAYLYNTLIDLYNVTKDYNNPMKYTIPMMLDEEGGEIVYKPQLLPYNNRGNSEVSDYIYENSAIASGVIETYTEPADYETDYAKYFQQNGSFTFRSSNNVYEADEIYSTPTGDYNVFYSYYRLLMSIAGKITDIEDIEGYVAGTYAGTLKVNTDTVINYSFADLDSLTRVVLGEDITSIPQYAFVNSTNIQELILLYAGGVVTVPNVATLQPLKNKTIKVPADLVESYRVADYWKSTSLNLTFVAI